MKQGDLPELLWMKSTAVVSGDMISDLVCISGKLFDVSNEVLTQPDMMEIPIH
jgi:hypothetical protein